MSTSVAVFSTTAVRQARFASLLCTFLLCAVLVAPAVLAIGYRDSSSAAGSNTAGTASLTLTVPENTLANDVLVAQVAFTGLCSGVTGPGATTPGHGTQWSLLQCTDRGVGASDAPLGQAVYTRVATQTDALRNFTWTFSPALVASAGGIAAYAGVATVSPVDSFTQRANADSASINPGAIVANSANDRLIGLYTTRAATTIAPPAGMTENWDVAATSAGGALTVESADRGLSAPGASGLKIATAGTSAPNIAALLALRPATVGFATPTQSVSENVGIATIPVILSSASSLPTTVDFTVNATSTALGTGPNSDYTLAAGQVTFLPGEVAVSIAVPIHVDNVDEPSETLVLRLSNAVNANLGTPQTTVTILDIDDPQFRISATDPTATENSTDDGRFTIERVGSSALAVNVNLAFSGTAVAADYFGAVTGATFAAGETFKDFPIDARPDGTDEPTETVVATILAGSGYSPASGASAATVSLIDVDLPAVRMTITDASATEQGGTTGQFVITRDSDNLTGPLVVRIGVSGSAVQGPGGDYNLQGATVSGGVTRVTIAAGAATQTVVVNPTDDTIDEPAESAGFAIQPEPTYRIGAPSAGAITFTDNDPVQVRVTVLNATATEGDASRVARFQLCRHTLDAFLETGDPPVLQVSYTVGGTASSGDHTAASGQQTIGQSQACGEPVEVRALADSLDEGDETVVLTVQSGPGYGAGTPSNGTVVLRDANDPVVTVSVFDGTGAEAGGDPVSFQVTRTNGDVDSPLAVQLTIGGTANGGDYAAVAATVAIPAGQTVADVTFSPVDDGTDEPTETVTLALAAGAGYVIGTTATLSATIADDDNPSIGIVVDDDRACEPSGTVAACVDGPLQFRVVRYGDPSQPINVTLARSGTASAADVPGLPGFVLLAVDQENVTFSVTPSDDAVDEQDETVIVTVVANTGYTVNAATPSASGTIFDTDVTVFFTTASQTALETVRDATFTARLSRAVGWPVSVHYASTNGTAHAPADYAAVSGTLLFAAGNTTQAIATTIVQDDSVEPTETFTVALSVPANVTLGTPATTQYGIGNEDVAPIVGFAAGTGSGGEAASPAPLTVRLNQAKVNPVHVNFTVLPSGTATSGSDYVLASGTITIPAGALTTDLNAAVLNDAVDENNENFEVRLTSAWSPGGPVTIGGFDSHRYTIVDDDDPPTIRFHTGASTTAESGTVNLPVVLSGPSGKTVSVQFSASGNATSGSDYTLSAGTLTFLPGSTTRTIAVGITSDTTEEENEVVRVTLANAGNAQLAAPSVHDITIVDDDGPIFTLFASDDTASEDGTDTGEFRFISDRTLTRDLVVRFVLTGTSVRGVDYADNPVLASGSLSVLAGSTDGVVVITGLPDSVDEPDKLVEATLQAGPGYRIGTPGRATVTILDDDVPTVTVESIDPSAYENPADQATFVFTRTAGDLSAPLAVVYTVGGSAANGVDYAALSGTVTIAAGLTSANVVVAPTDDGSDEPIEFVVLAVAPDAAYLVGSPASAQAAIADDDPPMVSLTVADGSAAEGSDEGQFIVRRVAPDDEALTVHFTVAAGAGAATPDADYSALSGTAVIPEGMNETVVTVHGLQDDVDEPVETVAMTLSSDATYVLGTVVSGSVSIQDDDLPMVTVAAVDASAVEPAGGPGVLSADAGTFRVTRTAGDLSGPLEVQFAVTGTASDGSDYETIGSAVTILAGATQADVTVSALHDADDEPVESVVLTLAGGEYVVGAASSATVDVVDNDPPTVSVTAFDADASETGPDTATFRLVRTEGDLSGPLGVHFTFGGTAAGGDYTSLLGYVVIPAGDATVDVTVTPVDDAVDEHTETVRLVLASDTAYTVGLPASAVANVTDDDDPEVHLELDADAFEGGASGAFAVARSGSLALDVTVHYTVDASVVASALPGTDYVALSGSVLIPAGNASAWIPVVPLADTLDEPTEGVVVQVDEASGYTLAAPDLQTLFIFDDDLPVVTLAATAASATEDGAATGTFTVTRTDGDLSADLQVDYSVTGTATSGDDYDDLLGYVVIPAGLTSATVDVTAAADLLDEPDETVTATLTANPTAYRIGTPASDTVSIVDDDLPTVTLSASDASASEAGPDTAAFTVTRTAGDVSGPLTVLYSVGGTADHGTDFSSLSGMVTIAAGNTSATVQVTPIDDAPDEQPETVGLTLAADAAYVVGTVGAVMATISDDDPPTVTLSATDANASESSSDTGTFTITRTDGDLSGDLVVQVTVGGTAAGGADYVVITDTLTISGGFQSREIVVTPVDDGVDETVETVTMALRASASYVVGSQASASISLADNDPPAVTVAASDASASETGPDEATFTVTRTDGDLSGDLTVNVGLGGTATPGTDYSTLASTVTIPAGQATATVTVETQDDSADEAPETVVLTIVAGTGYTIGPASAATATIADNDLPAVTIQATDAAASEAGPDAGTFTVTRTSGDLSAALVVNLVASGTASSGSDFTALGATVGIPAGQSTATVTVQPVDDAADEAAETVVLTVAAGAGYTVGGPATASVTIADNDLPTVTMTATDAAAGEPSNTGTFTVTRASTDLAGALVVAYTVGGTATSGSDYTALPGTVTIAAGATSATVTVTPVDNSVTEPTETVIVTLAANAAYVVGTPSSGTVSITDDDTAIVSISAVDAVGAETGSGSPSNNGLFRVTRSGGSLASPLTVSFNITGSATAGTDYTSFPPTVTIDAGASSKDILVKPKDDSLVEGDEAVVLTIVAGASYVPAASPNHTAAVTIQDNERAAPSP